MTVAGALALLAFGACKKEAQVETPERGVAGPTVNLPSGSTLPLVIPQGDNYILAAGGTYFLNGKTYVDSAATLTINAGVTIKGVKRGTGTNAADSASALIVTRGGQIFANGTEASPITFTSAQATPAVGDWGGVVIMGRARTNQNVNGDPTIEGIALPTLPAGVSVRYGSTNAANDADNSGVFKYVRILYAGAAIATNNELNSLTLGGVGSGTEIHHVAVAFGQDDAFEFFGGTVSPRYLVSLNTNDDIFDFDFGYTGKLQFILGVRRASGTGASYADANGIESDNDGNSSSLTPRTQAQISNMTLISGPETGSTGFTGTLSAARLRRNTNYLIRNSVLFGYNTGINLEVGTANAANIAYNIIHGYTTAGSGLPATNTTFTGSDPNNTILLSNPYGVGATFQPWPLGGASPAETGANFAGLSGFSTVAYRGAVPPDSTGFLKGAWINGIGL